MRRTPVGSVPAVAVAIVGAMYRAVFVPMPLAVPAVVAFGIAIFIGVANLTTVFALLPALFSTLLPALLPALFSTLLPALLPVFFSALLLAKLSFVLAVVVLFVVFIVTALEVALLALSSSLPVLIVVYCTLVSPVCFGESGGS
ncbi:hypothetical protein GCM10027180_24850 [Microbulbifer echini]